MRLFLLGGTLLVLAVVLEMGTRLFTDIAPPLLVKDPLIGRRYEKSFQAKVYVPEAGREVSLRFNRHGFRGSDRPFAKPSNVRRVAVLGDSFIASVGVDEADTLVARLEKMLNESHSQVTWEVMNFGVSGSGPGQEIALYRELVQRFEPDIVLGAFFVGNDLADNCNRLSRQDRIYFDFDDQGNYRQLPYSAPRARVSVFLNRYSRFYIWQKDATMRVRDTARDTLQVIPPGAWIFSHEEPPDVAYAWQLAAAAIDTLHREVTQQGGLFSLVLIPSAEQIYTDRWDALVRIDPRHQSSFDWDHPDQRLVRICQELGVPVVTMTGEFRSAAPNATSAFEEQWLFHQGMGHLNERGNEIAADVVYRFLTCPAEQVAGAESFVRLAAKPRSSGGGANDRPVH